MRLRKTTRKIEVSRCWPSSTKSDPDCTATVGSGVPRVVTGSGGQRSHGRVENGGSSPSHVGSHKRSAPTGYDLYSESNKARTRSADQTKPRCKSGKSSR